MPDFRFDTALDRWREMAAAENARMRERLEGERGANKRVISADQRQAMEMRRQEVRRMWWEGERIEVIRQDLGCSRNTVVNDLVAMGLWKQ